MKNLNRLLKNVAIFQVLTCFCFVRICDGQSEDVPFEQRYFHVLTSSPYEDTSSGSDSDNDNDNSTSRATGYSIAADSNSNETNARLSRISSAIPKNALFRSFNPEHISAVRNLTEILLQALDNTISPDGVPDKLTAEKLLDTAQYFKSNPNVNARLWYRAFLTAQLIKTPDTIQVNKPSGIELFPSIFFPTQILEEETSDNECVLLDERIGADNGFENRLWYFRENVQLNLHHWNWHLRHPNIINETVDRRGESFYFFHHELLARYTAERLSNGLRPTEPLDIQLDTVIEEGYKPHLKDGISGRNFAERKPFSKITDVNYDLLDQFDNRTNTREDLIDLITERNRVLDSITQAGVLHSRGFLEIKDYDRINILGELVEASRQSINPQHYGTLGYHATGHILISRVNRRFGSQDGPGVIIDLAATARDPVFYRWHAYIDVVFQAYKLSLLKPHTPHGGTYPLTFKGIKVNSVQVVQEAEGEDEDVLVPANHLETFWTIQRFDLAGDGIDFNPNDKSKSPVVNICAKHLDHTKFYYEIEIENSLKATTLGTVRIFMAPRYKSAKTKVRFSMEEQRSLFFSMDSFQTVLEPGKNVLVRRSIDSSLTADFPLSMKELKKRKQSRSRTVCECGFPQHLLLPKGKEKGMLFDLFVMVTDGLEDAVRNNFTTSEDVNVNAHKKCPPSHIHCGLPGKKYPDSKPMGFPFDRRPYLKPIAVKNFSGEDTIQMMPVHNLDSYVRDIPNMHASQVLIQHHNEMRGAGYYEATENFRPLRLKKF